MQDSPLNKLSNQNKSELYSYVKKNINKHIHSSECTDLVLDAKDPEGKTLKFYLKFKDGSTIVSSNTHKVVVDLTSKFLKKYLTKQEFKKINFKISGNIEEAESILGVNPLKEASAEAILMFSQSLSKLLQMPELPQKIELLSNPQKIQYLRDLLLEKAIINDKLKICFPFIESLQTSVKFTALDKCINHIDSEHSKIGDNVTIAVDNAILRINQHLRIYHLQTQDDESYINNWELLFAEIALQNISDRKKWYKIRFLHTLLEDVIEAHNEFIQQLKTLQNKFRVCLNSRYMITQALAGISQEDQIALLGSIALNHAKTLSMDEEIGSQIHTAIDRINSNLRTFSHALSITEKMIKVPLDSPHSKTNSTQISPVKNIQQIGLPDTSPTSTSSTASLSDTTAGTSAIADAATTEQLNTDTPFSFFENSSSTSTNSITAAYKKVAKEKIAEMDRRTEAHENRAKNSSSSESMDAAEILSNKEKNPLQVYIHSQKDDKPKLVNIFCLAHTKHLYMTCDGDISPEDKFNAFKNVALQGKVLTQNSLGKNGIKMYGLDFLIIKSTQFPAEHLVFIAHQIGNTEDYVYIPHEIISHQKYEKILNNRHLLENYAENARKSIRVDLTIGKMEHETTPHFQYKNQ